MEGGSAIRGGSFLTGLMLALTLAASAGEGDSPVGKWRQIDDQTGKAQSIVEIYRDGDVLKGKLVEILGAGEGGAPRVCDECEGALEGHPYRGFPLIVGMKKHGDEWSGGYIVDPSTGKRYQAKLSLSNAGRELKVRGFFGIALFGRTQVWERVDSR